MGVNAYPENVTADVAGNKNLELNMLRYFHYSIPTASLVLSSSATGAFVLTVLVVTLLTVSTTSLQNYRSFVLGLI
ncbi:hypothetical protein L1987_14687 [Smallanthus sonchifolius]|uniref:Uncharacterized protein n=1 Tax=Smallanthus sonchifolius TaxID=185202 RepID=A0ACB9J5I8_9ASTR|nr:hypothetical protein L1987_14687 [Smallanthus sonchifolius]